MFKHLLSRILYYFFATPNKKRRAFCYSSFKVLFVALENSVRCVRRPKIWYCRCFNFQVFVGYERWCLTIINLTLLINQRYHAFTVILMKGMFFMEKKREKELKLHPNWICHKLATSQLSYSFSSNEVKRSSDAFVPKKNE